MTRTAPVLALAAVLALASAPSAEATISRAIRFDDKVEGAAAIVLGRCVSQQARWDEARNWILTYSTFRIEKTLKGAPVQEITLVTPGGTVGSIAQEVVGVPRFHEGDEHVVFVRNSQAGPTVLYLEQGSYRVVKDQRGDRIVQPSETSAVFVDTGRGTAVQAEPPRSLREFEGAVRETIRRREAVKMEMMKQQKREQASLWNTVQRNRLLVLLAIAGILLASWQLLKKF